MLLKVQDELHISSVIIVIFSRVSLFTGVITLMLLLRFHKRSAMFLLPMLNQTYFSTVIYNVIKAVIVSMIKITFLTNNFIMYKGMIGIYI